MTRIARAAAVAALALLPALHAIAAAPDAKPAFAYMASGAHFGKVAIAIG